MQVPRLFTSLKSLVTTKKAVAMPPRIPAEVFPPGEFIREELDARGWTQGDLAEIMDRPLQLVNELIAGKKQITPETAMGLAKAFGDDDALYWMNLDSVYRLANTKPVNDSVARRSKLYSLLPVRELMKRNWIEPSDNLDVVEHRVCRFYRITSVDQRPVFAHAAKATQAALFGTANFALCKENLGSSGDRCRSVAAPR
jgi:HTH-type transcriptional regulator/antitoxin HigA